MDHLDVTYSQESYHSALKVYSDNTDRDTDATTSTNMRSSDTDGIDSIEGTSKIIELAVSNNSLMN